MGLFGLTSLTNVHHFFIRSIAYEIKTPVGTSPKTCKALGMPSPQSLRLLLIPHLHVSQVFSICKASFRRMFIASAAFFALARQSSSLKAMSSIQCRLFSIAQCSRVMRKRSFACTFFKLEMK